MVQASTEVGFTRSVLNAEIEASPQAPLLGALVGLVEHLGRARRDDRVARMRVLGAVAEEPRCGRDVAAALDLDPSTVSRHLAALEAAGFAERSQAAGDRRMHRVAATPAGRAAYADHLRARLAVVGTAVAGWPAEDRTRLAELLERLVADLAAAALVPADAPTPRNGARA